MKALSITLFALTALPVVCHADQSEPFKDRWLVRVRALDLQPNSSSVAFSALGSNFPSNALSLQSKWFPELDLSYFFTRNVAAELVLTYPQQHDVSLAGVGRIGTITHLPPILSIQYHLPIEGSPAMPYVGIGLNYTTLTSQNLSVAGTALSATKLSVGPALGAGVDYKLNNSWSLNLDYKYVYMATNVKVSATGTYLTNLRANPNLFSVGIGYRF